MQSQRVTEAVRLMDTAWAKRGATISSPPPSTNELAATIAVVQDDLVRATEICRETGAQRELVTALRRLGHVEQDVGRTEQTRALYEEATNIARDIGDPILLAHTVRHLGDIHRNAGRVSEASGCYSEAIDLYRRTDDPPKLDFANALRPMAILKEESGEVAEAIALWKETREYYDAVGVKEGFAECSEHLNKLKRR